MNTSGSEDWLQRLSVLFLMAMLVGYSANASAIDLGHWHDAVPTSNVEHATEPVIDVPEATVHLIRRLAEAAAGSERPGRSYIRPSKWVTDVLSQLLCSGGVLLPGVHIHLHT